MSWTARTESRKDAGSVNTGSYWRDRGPGARPTALHRSGAICDYADRGRRRRFAAVATPADAHLKPNAAARLARDIDQSSRGRPGTAAGRLAGDGCHPGSGRRLLSRAHQRRRRRDPGRRQPAGDAGSRAAQAQARAGLPDARSRPGADTDRQAEHHKHGTAVRTAAGRPVPAVARDLHERGSAAGRPADLNVRLAAPRSRATPLANAGRTHDHAVTMNLREEDLSAPAESTTTTMVVAAHDVTRDYGEGDTIVQALRGVDLEIPPGQFTAVMGPSGSGKSTLMHILAGLDRPTTGSVSIDGQEITAMGDQELTLLRRRHIGFIFQFFNLLPMLTAEENIVLPLRIAGRDAEPGWVDEVISKVGLADRRTHRPAELSGGQQQRVAIARGLVTRPTVMFADEPTGNLDSTTSAELLALLRDAVESYAQTTVMVTHDARASAMADRILFLADGLIVRDQGRASSEQDVLTAMAEVSGQ